LAAAQVFQATRETIPNLMEKVREGDFAPLLTWLRENIHALGSSRSTDDILQAATGAPLGVTAFKAHLQARYLQGGKANARVIRHIPLLRETAACGYLSRLLFRVRSETLRYISTRGKAPILNFEDVVLTGLARDGGLYLPESWPQFSEDDIRSLAGKRDRKSVV